MKPGTSPTGRPEAAVRDDRSESVTGHGTARGPEAGVRGAEARRFIRRRRGRPTWAVPHGRATTRSRAPGPDGIGPAADARLSIRPYVTRAWGS
ncbi:hypothetical protein [Streptomyces caeruleatus]|uniref:Uncharacterized protein n=1 Tax=Streptomyces caeruleatus TaxID=661399 RepID=A0A117RQ59_9ACTN|nr:hypothetical protein [Streptomyces caeruleatus]KUO03157.1 hypothetical protein AQJ67_18175 [Streptomyces caeruleatus]